MGAMWMLANCKNGVSSYEIHRSLGVTQKTAWFMLQRIRTAMQEDDSQPLTGIVEMDETFVGGKAKNMHAKASVRLFARRSGNIVQDERDQAVASLGARWSNLILWIGLVVILVLYWDHGSVGSAHHLIGLLFHLLLLAGIARILRELVAYRQAA